MLIQAELEGLSDSDDTPAMTSPTTAASAPTGNEMLTLIQERLQMYEVAQSQAKLAGDSSKARRMDRGVKVSGRDHKFL